MRADRLISILMLLQGRGRMTARELARRLEVSERTIHRDMEALSAAGAPVYALRGAGGGWALPDGYRTQLTGLTEPELQALFAARPERVLADLGLGAAGQGAELKLLAALPQSRRSEAERMLERVHIDAPSWRRPAEPAPLLPDLQQALWADRRVSMRYRRSDGTSSQRVVDPLGLVAKGNLWYLVARQGDDMRTFRVSRVEAVTVLDEAARRPEGFDLPSWWEASSRAFLSALPRYTVTARVAPEAMTRLRRPGGYVEVESLDAPDRDGWQRLALHFEVADDALGYVLAFGASMEVLGPPEFRERLVALARATLEMYGATCDDCGRQGTGHRE